MVTSSMNAAFAEIEEKSAYMRDLCMDKLFASLDEEAREKHLEESIDFGQRITDDFTARYGSSPSPEFLREIVTQNGATIKEIKDDGNLPFLSEYVSFGARIELFPKKIEKVQGRLHMVNPDFFSSYSLKDMCIAHEFFHHIERGLLKGTGRVVGLAVKRLGIFPAVHYVSQSSEVAAHTFVKYWLKLSFSPCVFKEIIQSINVQRTKEN